MIFKRSVSTKLSTYNLQKVLNFEKKMLENVMLTLSILRARDNIPAEKNIVHFQKIKMIYLRSVVFSPTKSLDYVSYYLFPAANLQERAGKIPIRLAIGAKGIQALFRHSKDPCGNTV